MKGQKLSRERLQECYRRFLKWTKELEEAKAKGKKRMPPKPETLGVSGEVHCDADPWRFALPLLHILIGLLNKALQTMREWLDVKVEFIGEHEMMLRWACKEAVKEHAESNERLSEARNDRDKEKQNRQRLLGELLSGQRTHEKDLEFERIEGRIEELTIEIEEIENDKPILKMNEANLKKKVKAATEARVGDKDGLDTIINEIMRRRAMIVPQAFHGGQLNGVHCRRLLNEVEDIMKDISKEATKRLKENIKKYNVMVTQKELDGKFVTFTSLFQAMDLVFYLLRQPAPTPKEVKDAEEAVYVLEQLWKNLELNITVKAHLLFEHGIEQFTSAVGGIADRVEDFIEKYHQKIKRLDHLTNCMPDQCFKTQQLVQIRRLYQENHPEIQRQIAIVNERSKRNLSSTGLSAEQRNKHKRRKTRGETQRSAFFQATLIIAKNDKAKHKSSNEE